MNALLPFFLFYNFFFSAASFSHPRKRLDTAISADSLGFLLCPF